MRTHDPFAHGGWHGGDQQATTSPDSPEERLGDPAVGEGLAEPQEATQEAVQQEPEAEAEPWAVPQKAADIVVALRQTEDADEKRVRAEAVKAVEDQREGGPRPSVQRAVAEILG